MTNTKPLVQCVRKCKLGFLEHILWLPEEEPTRRYAFYRPISCQKRRGCPCTSYLAYIQHVLGNDENEMAGGIATLAKDQCA